MMSEELAFDDEKQATNAPQMPWKLEYHPRSGGEMIPWVIGTDGMQRCATAEEVQVWEYIKWIKDGINGSDFELLADPARVRHKPTGRIFLPDFGDSRPTKTKTKTKR
jgi:hypothetical protein